MKTWKPDLRRKERNKFSLDLIFLVMESEDMLLESSSQ